MVLVGGGVGEETVNTIIVLRADTRSVLVSR